jgi:hypothetical protein
MEGDARDQLQPQPRIISEVSADPVGRDQHLSEPRWGSLVPKLLDRNPLCREKEEHTRSVFH